MTRSTASLSQAIPLNTQWYWQSASVPAQAESIGKSEPLAPWTPAVLAKFKVDTTNKDRKHIDYLVLGLLSLLIHTTLIQQFDRIGLEQDLIEPEKPAPKVQITLSRPQPKPIAPPPPPIAKPKPVVPKAVPLKPPKPKPIPKIVEQTPTPSPAPIVDNPQVVDSPAPAAPQAAAPVVAEKITAPSAGADYLNNPPPVYPEIAMERGWEGKVLMKVHVLPDGHPDTVSVIKSSGQQVLDDAAVKTVHKWSFVPAKRGDTPIAGWVTVPITFKLS